jgi:FkbM family methyltransferase
MRLDMFFDAISDLPDFHAPGNAVYKFLQTFGEVAIAKRFSAGVAGSQEFGNFGSLDFPFQSLGEVTTLDLFGIDELILFSFYWRNRYRYRKVADIGANLGLHSIILSKCGYEVLAFEPDPLHFDRLQSNLINNHCENVQKFNCAVSDQTGKMEFLRVHGNTTGSHLAGSKSKPYGIYEAFEVDVLSIRSIMNDVDFLKIDAEGHERQILLATTTEDWKQVEAMVEIGSARNAEDIFAHLMENNVNLFAQKSNWKKISTVEEMPFSYKEGSLFITSSEAVPW